MKRCAGRTFGKIALFLVTALMITVSCVCFVFLGYSNLGSFWGDMWKPGNSSYENTKGFELTTEMKIHQIMDQQIRIARLEDNGTLNMNKPVNVLNYSKAERNDMDFSMIQMETELKYTLDQLKQWADNMYGNDLYMRTMPGGRDNPVVACQLPDYTYEYFYAKDLVNLLKEGKLVVTEQGYEPASRRSDAASGEAGGAVYPEAAYVPAPPDSEEQDSYPADAAGFYGWNTTDLALLNEKGEMKYIGFWVVEGSVPEMFAPQGYSGIVEFVNKNPQLNGLLTEVYERLNSTAFDVASDLKMYEVGVDDLAAGNTNLRYVYIDTETGRIDTNIPDIKGMDSARGYIDSLPKTKNVKYIIIRPKLEDFQSNFKADAYDYRQILNGKDDGKGRVLAVAVDTKFPIQDDYYKEKQAFNSMYPFFIPVFIIMIVSFGLGIVGVIWNIVVTGKKGEDGTIRLGCFDKIKTELFLIITGLAVYLLFVSLYDWFVNGVMYSAVGPLEVVPYYIMAGVHGYLLVCAVGAGILSFVRRVKAHTMWKNSILYRVLYFVREVWRNLPDIWRSVLTIVGFLLLQIVLIFMTAVSGSYLLFLFLIFVVDAVAVYYVAVNAISFVRIRKGLEKIAGGDLDFQISRKHMYGENWHFATLVNQIAEGLNRAVEENVKNERLKTDLITNVSHDIKTPLTSIITYIMLLKREKFDNPKIEEYINILEQKANRLKTLTEDVVEASKVSSGNITIERTKMNFVEMLWQVNGEFEDKFAEENLTLVTQIPKDEIIIDVDGRRMWRILANLYSNAVKYAMPGTRVYVSLEKAGDKACFTIKNTSSQQLNIPAEELTERFIRGDISRSSEGSGLGLAIAKSLTQMMGGQLDIELDADLFKAKVTVDMAGNEDVSPEGQPSRG